MLAVYLTQLDFSTCQVNNVGQLINKLFFVIINIDCTNPKLCRRVCDFIIYNINHIKEETD